MTVQVEETRISRSRVIDTNRTPFVPPGWEVVEHKKDGLFLCEPKAIELHYSQWQLQQQRNRSLFTGYELREKIADKPLLNACVLDFLLAHPDQVPAEWKGKDVYFWGTIYKRMSGLLAVRCLLSYSSIWDDFLWLDADFRGNAYAAVSTPIGQAHA